jgi:hypothetical protein
MYTYTVGKKSQIDSVFTNGYSRQFAGDAEGVDYGIGVYCNISYNDKETPRESLGRYSRDPQNNCIFRNELEGGLDRFLIFDERFARKVYGEHYFIKDQVYRLFPKDVADDLWKDIKWYMSLDTSSQGNGNHMNGRTSGLLQFMMSKHLRGNVANPKKYENIFGKYNVRGAIYRGRGDGFCMVVYNYDEIKPVAYSVDGGRTYLKKNVKYTYPDIVRRLRHLYKKIDFPIAIQGDDRIYYFAKVQKKNGKWNYVDATTQEEISVVDFDSCTSINPNNGMFQIEYNGKFYNACPDGFFDSEDEGHTWDELPLFDEDIDSLDEDTKRFNKLLVESFKNVLSDYNMFSEILNEIRDEENDVDEVSYYHYNVPDLSYFDSSDVPSIYHVTKEGNVEDIFRNGFDREFLSVYAYGKGVYAAYDVANGRNQIPSYGTAMLQLKLIGGYDRFLIFPNSDNTKRLAIKYYGNNYDILSQLKSFLPERIAIEVYGACGSSIEGYSHYASKYHIRGAVYQWGRTIAVLPYDFSTVVPYAVSYDGGKTFKKKINNRSWQRFLTNIDVEWRYSRQYKKIEKPILGYNSEGQETGYAKVQKKNGKWNYIDIQTGNEELPFDFDSLTSLNPETGDFQAEYKGNILNACFDGFYDNDGDGHTWNELDSYLNNQNDLDL